MSQAVPPIRRLLYCCPICDVPISRTDSFPGDLPQVPLEWHQKLYFACKPGRSYNSQRRGLHQCLGTKRMFPKTTHSFDDADPNIYIYSLSPGSWPRHFCLHTLCWDILVQRTPGPERALTRFSTFMFNMLHCTPPDKKQPGAVTCTAFSIDRPYLTEDLAPGPLGEYLSAEPLQPQDLFVRVAFLILEEHCVGARPPWIGVQGHGQAPVAAGSLEFGHERRRVRLVACFDSLKMFGLGVVDASVPETEIRHVLRPQPVWTPFHPQETVALLPQPRISLPRTISPFLNMDFGGQYGEKHAHIVKMVVHLSKDASAAVGISFYFDIQRAIHFGDRGRKRVFTLIDGPGGERIRAIKFEQLAQSGLSVQICTRVRSGPLLPRLGIPIPIGEWVPEANELKPALGQRITGFTAILAASSHSFQSFGLQCEEIPLQHVDSQESLKEIKQIYFSGGDPDGEEPQRVILGLHFDYHRGFSSEIEVSQINDYEHVILRFRENHLEELNLFVSKYSGNLDDIRVLSSSKTPNTRIRSGIQASLLRALGGITIEQYGIIHNACYGRSLTSMTRLPL
ncbi:hypothetical protein BJX65DRAFT_309615 [Aspergillus insuetus]